MQIGANVTSDLIPIIPGFSLFHFSSGTLSKIPKGIKVNSKA